MAWLEDYTFPREARHHDLSLARREYSKLLQRLISNGTTTALYFATLHLEPTQLLAQLLHQVCILIASHSLSNINSPSLATRAYAKRSAMSQT